MPRRDPRRRGDPGRSGADRDVPRTPRGDGPAPEGRPIAVARRDARRARRLAGALAALGALAPVLGCAEVPVRAAAGDDAAPASARDDGWRGEIGLFNFGYLDAQGKRRPALIEGDPSGRRMAGTVVRQSIFWGCVEPRRGEPNMEKCRQVRLVDGLLSAGWSVHLLIRTKQGDFGEGPFWATDPGDRAADADISHAPADLRADPSPEFGFSESYYRFVRTVVDRFCVAGECRIHGLVIENEANSGNFWRGRDGTPQGDVDDYVKLVATARKAVDDSGARLPLFDSGLQGYTLIWNAVAEALDTRGAEAAADLYRNGFNRAKAPGSLKREIRKRRNGAAVVKTRLMLESELYRYTDGINFHHYQTPESVPDVIRYLRRHAPAELPLVTNEVGIKDNIIRSTDEDLADAWMIRKLVYLFDGRVSPVIWFSVRGKNNIGGITDGGDRFKPAAARAYNAFAARVGAGVADVELATVAAGGRDIVRAVLRGSGGTFAVEWFVGDAGGDWRRVAGPAGCAGGAAAYENRYLRIMDCP